MDLPVAASAKALVSITPAQAAIEQKYEDEWKVMHQRPERIGGTMLAAKRILAGKEQYKKVELALGVPWPVVGVIHERESSCDFKTHLHNGDPLSKRTTHVPKGRPVDGEPPFDWYESAIDALRLQGADKVPSWTIGATGRFLEDYNGDGYRNRGLPSPYVLAGSDLYTKGKYVEDGKFSKNFVDPQPGCFPLLQCLIQLDPSIVGDQTEPLLPKIAEKPLAIAPPAPPTPKLVEAVKSKTVHAAFWGTVMLKVTTFASLVASAIDSALQSAPTIKSDVDEQMGVINGLASTAHIDLATVGTWIGVALLLYAVSRHLDLKSWLHNGGVK
jgi:lysozyme family protein